MPTVNAYHTFIPHLRQGLADRISFVDNYSNPTGSSLPLVERADISIDININATSVNGGTSPLPAVVQQLLLKGPGDITGINSSEIVKKFPADWTTNFEPNYLPYIEFYDEDFPWRYTPAKAKHESGGDNLFRLRPWISLIVLKEDEFDDAAFKGVLPSIQITSGTLASAFPPSDQIWAWAHVHVNDDLGEVSFDPTTLDIQNYVTSSGSVPWTNQIATLQTMLKNNPDLAVSRIICPRRLEPNTGYHAFLVPTFEMGRLAGLGPVSTPVSALLPAWTSSSFIKEYPYYTRWFFKTGVGGDFESLVRLLKPKAVGNEAGKRAIDLQLPGNPMIGVNDSPNPTIGLQGILHPIGQTPDSWPLTSNFVTHLKQILNNVIAPQASNPDPIVGPPVYGRWHAQVSSLAATSLSNDWVDVANLDPRFRTFAGIGAEVVRKNQDKYMAIAWKQVGAIIEANRRLRQMQLALEASQAMHDKHLVPMTDELLLNVTAPAHGKIKANTTQTVYKEVEDHAIPNSMLSGAFRRITNPGGALMRTMSKAGLIVDTTALIYEVNTGNSVLASSYAAPTAMTYSAVPTSSMTSSYAPSLPPMSSFYPSSPGSPTPPVTYGPLSTPATNFISAVSGLGAMVATMPGYTGPATKPQLPVGTTRYNIDNSIRPSNSVLELATKQVRRYNVFTVTYPPITTVAPVMAAPKIDIPMYQDLVLLSTEWMMPGLNAIPDNSICLLQMDQAYIEAFMLGANYEMARELLWRGFPTDQRGTYFSFFWEYSSSMASMPVGTNGLDPYRDIYPIEQWRNPRGLTGYRTALGGNSPRLDALNNPSDMLILTIRGELFRRYPGTKVYLQEAEWDLNTNNTPKLSSPRHLKTGGATIWPVFSAQVYPDIYFLAFPKNAADIKGVITDGSNPGYFFVFQEHAGEVKFGADEPTQPIANYSDIVADGTWNDITWGHIQKDSGFAGHINVNTNSSYNIHLNTSALHYSNPEGIHWGRNSANMAYILLQAPVKLDVHAKDLIP